jgi:3-hydroxybutyryl-CoA dehydratase
MRKYQVGDQAVIHVQVTDAMVRGFAELTGDKNPVHLDDAYAAKTRFKQRIAHGMIAGSLISRAIANELPGPGSVYLGQTLKFVAPVLIGDTVSVELKVTEVREDKNILTLETICRKQTGDVVLKGEATVLVQEAPSV